MERAVAEVVEHERGGPRRADRVGDAFAGDVGRGAVNRFEHRRVRARGVDVGARRDAEAAGNRGTDVGEDVAEEIRRHEHVERLRMRDHPRRERVDVVLAVLDRRIVLADDVGDLVPQHHRMRERVRLGRARDQASRALRRELEAVAQDPLDAGAREHTDLLRDLVRRAAMDAAADARVLALGVLAHAHHVDLRGTAVRERRREPVEEPHRPQVHVLIEPLADREDQRRGNAVGHAGRADRAEVDRVVRRKLLEPVLRHHAAVLQIVIAAPRQLGERNRHVGSVRRPVNRRHPRGNHFFSDAVARNHRDRVRHVFTFPEV